MAVVIVELALMKMTEPGPLILVHAILSTPALPLIAPEKLAVFGSVSLLVCTTADRQQLANRVDCDAYIVAADYS